MAYGDIAAFLPGESAYKTPGAYTEAMKMEATKRATYLSQMDQFYAGLEEQAREFDLGYELEQQRFGLEQQRFGLEEKYFGLAEESLDWQKEYGTAELGLKGRELDVQSQWYEGQLELGEKELGLKESSLALSKRESDRSYDLANKELDLAASSRQANERLTGQAIKTAGSVYTGSGSSDPRVVSSPAQNWWDAVAW